MHTHSDSSSVQPTVSRYLALFLFAFLLLTGASSVSAQCSVTVTGVTQTWVDGFGQYVNPGKVVRANLRWENQCGAPGVDYNVVSGFAVYSTDGALVNYVRPVPDAGVASFDIFAWDIGMYPQFARANGAWQQLAVGEMAPPDDSIALAFVGVMMAPNGGLGLGEQMTAAIEFEVRSEDQGKTICLDTACAFSAGICWEWGSGYGGTVIPDWYSEPMCWEILPCPCGNTDIAEYEEHYQFGNCDPVEVALQATATEGLYPIVWSCNVGEMVYSGDGTEAAWVWEDPEFPMLNDVNIEVMATNATGGVDYAYFDVMIANTAPILHCPTSIVTIKPGQTRIQTLTADDCSPLEWAVIDDGGVLGDVFISNGTVVFVSSPDEPFLPIEMVIGVSDGEYDAQCSIFWNVTSSDCCEMVGMGNIDNSPEGQVTMGDLTVLLDYLFISYAPLSCASAANLDTSLDGLVSMGDLTVLIDHLFIAYSPLPDCMGLPGFPASYGMVTDSTGCKTPDKDADQVPPIACMQWQYDASARTLVLTHSNAAFNCCPVIGADFVIGANAIHIVEWDSVYQGGCDCNCLYNVEYTFWEIGPGTYHVSVDEPLLRAPDEPFAFDIDLYAEPQGVSCLPRTGYPWEE